MIQLRPGTATLDELAAIMSGAEVALDPGCRGAVEASARIIAAAAAGTAPVYGVNTGFGKLASTRIDAAETQTLQRNLIRSHSAGVGAPLADDVVRLVMVLKLLSLARGASGVRWAVIELLTAMLNLGVTPVVPGQGSVGASGDLAPLAHLALVLMGEGEARVDGERLSGADALRMRGLEPLTFGPKEGLALINGTQVSTALALVGLWRTWTCVEAALVTGALATDAAMGSPAPFRLEVQALRGHRGQIEAGVALRALMAGSAIRESHRDGDHRVQDPYCIRCQPQVAGACIDLLRQAAATLAVEANAVTDNPLVLDDGAIVSGGNFHAEPVAFAADQIALAIAELGAVSQRRIALLVDPALSFGLPAFLTPSPGLNSGFMIAEVTSAALMSENKLMAVPASVDSTPTSANQEDHVSMACHAARRLLTMVDNLERIIAIEALTACQGVEFRGPLTTSPRLVAALGTLRASIGRLNEDRILGADIERAAAMVRSGELATAAGRDVLPQLTVTL